MAEMRSKLTDIVLASVVSSAVAGAVVGSLLKWQFEKDIEEFRAGRDRMSRQLTEVIGPATMHFARTGAVAERYGRSSRQLFGDAALLKDSNEAMRELLIARGHLIPADLLPPTHCLITHYDIWLKRFGATLEAFVAEHDRQPRLDETFDVGFAELDDRECGGFPEQVTTLYEEEFHRLRRDLYGVE